MSTAEHDYTDSTDLIAAAHAQVGHIVDMSLRERLIADLAAVLAQSELDLAEAQSSESWILEQKDLMRDQRDRAERDLDDARLVIATWRHDEADELDQLRQQLTEQAAVIEKVRRELPTEPSFEVDETNVRTLNAILAILSSTDTNEEKTNE